jgi:hypothetical protein
MCLMRFLQYMEVLLLQTALNGGAVCFLGGINSIFKYLYYLYELRFLK